MSVVKADLGNTYVAISVPCYSGKVPIEWAMAFTATQDTLREYGAKSYIQTRTGSGLIHTIRNDLVHAAMQRERVTHVLFIDDDVVWEPDAVMRLLTWGTRYPFVCAVYPTRSDEVNFPVDVLRDKAGRLLMSPEGLLGATTVPGGFMMLRRDVFENEALRASCRVSVPSRGDLKGERVVGFFDYLQEGEVAFGEDVSFCRRWTRSGGDIWVDTDIRLKHYGAKAYDHSFLDFVKARQFRSAA